MTEPTPVPPAEPPRRHEPEDDAVPMPRWVPVAIGVVLVTLAALAVITGMRYRDQTLVRIVQPRHRVVRTTAPAPPGEPEPGASLMFPGEANVPQAREPVGGPSRAEIAGGPGGVQGLMRLTARRGMRMNVTPPDAVVYVNDVAIGQASQFDSQDEEYDFAAPGSYTVRLIAPGFKERAFVVTAAENAQDEVALIAVKLDKE
jgi:hypothetical protein